MFLAEGHIQIVLLYMVIMAFGQMCCCKHQLQKQANE
jgi:hypothetical protein